MLFAQYLFSECSKVAKRSFVLRTFVVYSCLESCTNLERCPCLARTSSCWWASFFAKRRCPRLSSGLTFGDTCTSSDTSCPVLLWFSLMVALSGPRMYHQGLERQPWTSSQCWSFCERSSSCVLRTFFLPCVFHPCCGSGREFVHLCTLSFVWKHSVLALSVFVLRGHRLSRDIAVVLIASFAIWILGILPNLICNWKLKINGTWNREYTVPSSP